MRFADVPGHEELKKGFQNMMKSGRLSHALLLSSEAGRGKLMLARALAQYANCEHPSELDSCGECASCQKNEKLIHPDVHFTYPVIARKSGDKPLSKDFIEEWRAYLLDNPLPDGLDWLNTISGESAGNKQGNINVHECQDIIRTLNLKAFEGNYKIQIIWLPEFLGDAGNILLKLIEEPPEKTLFILVTNQAERILGTIHSRTQEIRVPPLKSEAIQSYIQKIGHDSASSIDLDLAEGNLARAVNILESDDIEFEEAIKSWLRSCARNRGDEMVDWAEQFNKWNRETQKQFLEYFLSKIRTAIQQRFGAKNTNDPMIGYLAERELESLEKSVELTGKSIYYLERNAHPRILILYLSIQLGKVFQNKAKFTTS